MLRSRLGVLTTLPRGSTSRLLPSLRTISYKADDPGTPSEEEQKAVRQWLASYNPSTIPRRICYVTFSRSSGPGGQNVNKTNSKATLRLNLKDLSHYVPSLLLEQLQSISCYSSNSNSLVIQSQASRKQAANIQDCHNKLNGLIVEGCKSAVRGETTPAQVARVKDLEKAANEARIRAKKLHSSKKSARTGSGSAGY